MAAKGAVSWGWIVAALLLVGLVSQCGKDGGSGTVAPGSASAPLRTEWRYVQPASANCRAGRSTNDAVVEKLGRNDFVGIVEQQEGWSLADRATDCWIRSDLLGNAPTPEPAPIRALMGNSGGGGSSTTTRRTSRRASSSAYYQNCSAARAAGAAPVYAGEPGYARRLDRDGDGVGCE